MSKSRKKHQEKQCNTPLNVYWQSQNFNQLAFVAYRQQLLSLALSRFRWEGLPPTCNERFLEYTLLFNGCATIAFPKKQKGVFYSTQVVEQSPPNVYDNPSKWRSVGNNGWSFNVTNKNGVFLYDNKLRRSILTTIDFFALELQDIAATRRLNRMHQKTPYTITAPQGKELDIINAYKQLTGNEPAMLGYSSMMDDINVGTINTQVTFIGEELDAAEINAWSRIYAFLGIPSLPFKAERQVEDEVKSNKAPSELSLLDPLSCRREAADKLNARFSEYLDEPIRVYFNRDIETDNFNTLHTLKNFIGGENSDNS